MPGEVAWSLEGGESGTFEILFPDEATSFQIYDSDEGIYRVVVIRCAPDDMKTDIFEFEKTPDIDIDRDREELEHYCDGATFLDTMEHTHGCLIETHVRPDIRMEIFIGHQAAFSNS